MSHRILGLARRVTTLSFAEWRDLLQAQWSLLVAHAIVRSRPTGSLAIPLGRIPELTDAARLAEAEAVARAVSHVARFGPVRARCLVRAVALSRMLRARGIAGSVVRIGVRRTASEFDAHAWVELGGVALGEAEAHVRSFAALTTVELAPERAERV